ncbi:MAG TPA: WG repeat-containing protein, partial [bacterium]|nr:WG repeat-containing protein [bacterium]
MLRWLLRSYAVFCINLFYVAAQDSWPSPYFDPVSYDYGYKDSLGRLVLPVQYDDARMFVHGIAAVKQNGLWFYIRKDGSTVFNGKYEVAGSFSEGYAVVWDKAEGHRLIDTTGRVQLRQANMKDVIRGRLVTSNPRQLPLTGLMGLQTLDGKTIVEPFFPDDESYVIRNDNGLFSTEGMQPPDPQRIPFQLRGLWGFVDAQGRIVMMPRYREARPFQEGLAAVRVDSLWGYIDTAGRFAIAPQFDDAKMFSEGLAGVRMGNLWGFIDKSGKVIIPFRFQVVKPFSEGLAVARVPNMKSRNNNTVLHGYIDKTGRW